MPGPDFEVEPEHLPMRGDAVEKWLKGLRDQYRPVDWVDDVRGKRQIPNREYAALDEALDEYRLRADTGLTLADDIADATEFRERKQTIVDRLEELRLEFQSYSPGRRDHPPPPFSDEGRDYLTRSGRRPQTVVTPPIACLCIHDLTALGGLCLEHELPMRSDMTCDCPKPL
jgi:hypothetical protein